MSDFTSGFWSLFVAGITAIGILGCLLLLWFSGKTRAVASTDNTTGHIWDGDLREMNNPLPRWWIGLFITTCVFSIIYLVLYPGMGTFAGVLGWSSHKQFDDEVAAGNAEIAPVYSEFANMSIEDMSKNDKAHRIGERLFMNNCSQCHMSDAKGAFPFPDLTDTAWNWGGMPSEIQTTITEGRTGIMTPQADIVGSLDDQRNTAHYALSLSGNPHDADRAALGKQKFEEICSACHGMDGKGSKLVGAPDLTDDVWFLGSPSEERFLDQIQNGHIGTMPTWGSKFTPEQIRVLTAYVWGLGGGQPEVAPVDETAAVEPAAEEAAAPAEDAASIVVEGGVVKFFFATGSDALADGSDAALADILAGVNEGKRVVISGYVDSTGNADQNAELAKQRAQKVRDQLVALGVPETVIDMQKPADIDAGTGAQARRVEVFLQ